MAEAKPVKKAGVLIFSLERSSAAPSLPVSGQ
jgi:hypothetical protein